MIISSLCDLFISLVLKVFGAIELVGLPMEYINILQNVLAYGVWIVGLDIMSVFVATIVGWWAIKLAIGLFIFIWELLPLT